MYKIKKGKKIMKRKYQYFEMSGKTICVSRFAGKNVRGIAKWDGLESYDVHFGRTLAQARCDVKVAAKRRALAQKRFEEARRQYEAAYAYCDKMGKYLKDSIEAESAANDLVTHLLSIN